MIDDAYITLLGQGRGEYIEKRSKFIGFCAQAVDEDAALAAIAEERRKHSAADHLVYVYHLRIGNICRYTDGGEPQGTAGVPTLERLRRGGITDAVVTVARYFGGTLLGAGNLARAYAEAAKRAIEAAGRATMEPRSIYEITCNYTEYQRLIQLLAAQNAEISDSAFAEQVVITVDLAPARVEDLIVGLGELTKGKSVPRYIGNRVRRVKLD